VFIHGGSITNSFMMLSGLGGPQRQIGGQIRCGVPFRYFYVIFCEYGDSDGYRCQHRSARQLLGALVLLLS